MNNNVKAKGCLVLLVAVVGMSLAVYEFKYYVSYWSDLYYKPWAYSRDPKAKLLVGKWSGNFKDPDNVTKALEIEVFEPTTESERKAKATRRGKRGGIRRSAKRSFDGVAIAKSRLGTEKYEIYGSVQDADYHRMHFNFHPEDEKKRVLPNFTLLEANSGQWQDDHMQLTLSFAFHRSDGTSFWSSADPKHNQKVTVKLQRK